MFTDDALSEILSYCSAIDSLSANEVFENNVKINYKRLTMEALAFDRVDILDKLKKEGTLDLETPYICAASNKASKSVKWLVRNEIPFDTNTLEAAVKTGMHTTYKYLLKKGCKVSSYTLLTVLAVINTNFEVVDWILENKEDSVDNLFCLCIHYNNKEMLQYIHEKGHSYMKNLYYYTAAIHSSLEILKYFYEKGVAMTCSILVFVEGKRSNEIYDWFREIGVQWNVAEIPVAFQQRSTVAWLNANY